MFPLIVLFIGLFFLTHNAIASRSPDFTVLAEGYNLICKIPCLSCPFLVEKAADGAKVLWSERRDDSALLVNLTLAYNGLSIRLNNQELWPTPSTLPKIYASQVLQDISAEDLESLVHNGDLDSGGHGAPGGGGYFGLSYSFSAGHVEQTAALVLRFDIIEVWSDLLSKHILIPLQDQDQKQLEIIVLKRPTLPPLEPDSFEIVDSRLIPRNTQPLRGRRTMHFLEWDEFGRKGTFSRYISVWAHTVSNLFTSGVSGVLAAVFGLALVFLAICVLCIYGCSSLQDHYYQAQAQKIRSADEERRVGFRSPEELGLFGRGRVIGIGKSD